MPRRKVPGRLDDIANAATDVFIEQGFTRARVTTIAQRGKVGPGTIYLYAESKEALFDLALRRSWEDPAIWDISLPHPTPARGEIADHAWRSIQNATHFPLLWLAIDSPLPQAVRQEVSGILQELGDWLARYRKAIKLIERSTIDWPDLSQVFYRRFWRGGIRRIADYLGRRMRDGAIPLRPEPLVVAHVVVETLAWAMVHRHWSDDAAALSDGRVGETVYPLLLDAVVGKE